MDSQLPKRNNGVVHIIKKKGLSFFVKGRPFFMGLIVERRKK